MFWLIFIDSGHSVHYTIALINVSGLLLSLNIEFYLVAWLFIYFFLLKLWIDHIDLFNVVFVLFCFDIERETKLRNERSATRCNVFIVTLRLRLPMDKSSCEALPLTLAILGRKGIFQDLLRVFENFLANISNTLTYIHPVWVQFWRDGLDFLFFLNYALTLNIRHSILTGSNWLGTHGVRWWLESRVQVLLFDMWRAGSALVLSSTRSWRLWFDDFLLLII